VCIKSASRKTAKLSRKALSEEAVLTALPAKGASAGAVLLAPWRGLREQAGLTLLFYCALRVTVMHRGVLTGAFVDRVAALPASFVTGLCTSDKGRRILMQDSCAGWLSPGQLRRLSIRIRGSPAVEPRFVVHSLRIHPPIRVPKTIHLPLGATMNRQLPPQPEPRCHRHGALHHDHHGLRPLIVTLALTSAIILGGGACPVNAEIDVVADSVSQFSSVQGQDNWDYGYIDIASGPTFIPFTVFQTNYPTAYSTTPAWVIDPLPPVPPFGDTHFFTELNDVGGCPNALITSANEPREQWVDRQWTSTVSGLVGISGLVGDYSAYDNPDQDGVLAELLVDGNLIWSLQTDGHLHEIPYATSAMVSVGSTVDFIVKPGATDYDDQFTFTGVIQTPEPSSLALMIMASGALGLRLLVVKGPKGVIGCPYLNVGAFEKFGEACAIIQAADTAGMLDSKVTAVTAKAKELGIEVGMPGREALDKIR
jgi:uncharacterized protein YunC (DUF1805 family)